MSKQDAGELLNKYKAGDCTEEEKAIVETYYNQFNPVYSFELSDEQLETELNRIYNALSISILPGKSHRQTFLWPRIAAAASIVLVLSALAIILNLVHDPNAKDSGVMLSLSQHDISPGTNKATLTLANGKVINLSATKTGVVINASNLTYNDGTEVRDPAINDRHSDAGQDPGITTNTKLITTTIPRGGTYQVILPDGTHIWLNAGSTLKFPATFAHLKERKVELTGEAYFVVKHNTRQPFRVETKGQIVEDIGTEFNINAYTEEGNTKTTLIEGSARVLCTSRHPEFSSGPRNRKENPYGLNSKAGILKQVQDDVVLKPNQQSILTRNNQLKVTQVKATDAIAWKKGYFMFNDEPLEDVMRKISRWYNVDVVYQEESLKQENVYGTITMFTNVSKVLDLLELTKAMHFKITGKKIIVTK